MSALPWLVVALLTLGLALYVAAEFAAVSVRRGQIRALAQNGHATARRLLPTLEDGKALDRYIATCQIGITLTTLITGAYAQATIAPDVAALLQRHAGMGTASALTTAALATLVLLTVLQMVFGELIPKSLALQFPTRTALATYRPTAFSTLLYRPFIALLNGSGWFILRRLGVDADGSHRHVHSPEEIELLIAESSDGGLLEPDEKQRLGRALQLARRTARQLMIPRKSVAAVPDDLSPEALIETATTSPFTRLPVYHGTIDTVVGMVHTKDVAAAVAAGAPGPYLADLTRPVLSVPGSITAEQLLGSLRERRSRLAVVLDEFGGVEGIVTLEDVLAELVGDVGDEFKETPQAAERLPDGRVRLPGRLRLDEAAPFLGLHWHDDENDTVGGHVLSTLGRIPAPGDRLDVDGVAVEVEAMDGSAVASILATPVVHDDA